MEEMAALTIALRQTSEKIPEPSLFIQGDHGLSLDAKSPDDFAIKFRKFLDDLNHLKYLNHIEMRISDDLLPSEKKECEVYARVLGDVVRNVRMALGNREDSLLGFHNLMQNLGIVLRYPDASDLKIEKPFRALVVAAGPSLDLEYEVLRRAQDKVLIVCVDASLRALLREGIRPHVVVATERDEHSIPFFHDLPQNLETVLVGQPTIPREIFDRYTGPLATVFKFSGPFLWLPMRRAEFWAASSSAHVCYRLCAYWGASSIGLVGQDLSFHPDTNQSHAHLEVYHEWAQSQDQSKLISERRAFFVPGNTRKQVLTDPTWAHFAHDYSVMIDETKIPTINTSVHGMTIAGAPYMRLQDWLDQDAQKFSKPQWPARNPREAVERAATTKKIQDAIDRLSKLREIISRAGALEFPEEVYSAIVHYPHFLELVLEMVLPEYVSCENRCFGASVEARRVAQRKYLEDLCPALTAIIDRMKMARFDA